VGKVGTAGQVLIDESIDRHRSELLPELLLCCTVQQRLFVNGDSRGG
jgi:hypothetical protein